MNTILIAVLIAVLAGLHPAQGSADWFKGNIHTHTLNSDGDSSPDDVVRWYRDHRYDFLVITDHNFITDIGGLNAVFAASGKFLVIAGNEVSCSAEGKPVHMLAIDPVRQVQPSWNEATVQASLARNIEAILAAGALPVVNHPNFQWALTADDLTATGGWHILEIQNRHPGVNNRGGGGAPDTESLWDDLLGRGMRVYGVADDDAHYFKTFSPAHANPGRGWVVVRAEILSAEAITSAMAAGDFYFSTGVELSDVQSGDNELAVTVAQATDASVRYTTEFIGRGGRVLATASGTTAVYRLAPGDAYVRARITDSNGLQAWTQPLFAEAR